MHVRHIPALDGLRAIAVLLVLWCHVPPHVAWYPEALFQARFLVDPGRLGVDVFFVLSGFLITRILLDERARGVPVRWFLLRRLVRIFPIYYLLLAIMLAWRPAEEIGWCALYLHNFVSLRTPGSGPLDHTWSLCVEEHFYLLWPLVVAFAPRRALARLLVFVVMPAAVAAAIFVGLTHDVGEALHIAQRASPIRFLSLGAGALLACHETALRAHPRRTFWIAMALAPASIVGHGHVLFTLPMYLGHAPWLDLQHAPVVGLLHSSAMSTSLVLFAVPLSHSRWSPCRLLAAAPLRAIGRISYALYLYHLPIYFAVMGPNPAPWQAAAAITLTFAAASASWILIERPLQRLGSRWRGRGRGAEPASVTLEPSGST